MSDPIGEKTLEIMSQAPKYNQWLYQQLKPFISGEVAEVGAGTGIFCHKLDQDGFAVTALDHNPKYLQIIRTESPHIQVFQLDLESPTPPPKLINQFNSIIAINVLEHINTISHALTNIHTMLKPGGKLIVLIPACNWAYGSLDLHLGHTKRYSLTDMSILSVANGFRILSGYYINPLGLLGWWLNGKVLHKKILPLGQLKLFDLISTPFLWLEHFFHFPVGLSLVCVLEKL